MPFRFPQLTGLFQPREHEMDPQAMENFISNISALQDPRGTLERLQSEKIIAGMADAKTEGITGGYNRRALGAIQDFQSYSKGLYKQRKGFNRLTLSGDQMLEEDEKYKELLLDLNSLKGLTTVYKETINQAATDVHRKILTPENYKKFVAKLDQKNAEAKTIRDLPNARAVYNNFLTEIGVEEDNWLKELDDAMKVPMQQGSKRTVLTKDPQGRDINEINYIPWEDAAPIIQDRERIQTGLLRMFGGDEQKAQDFINKRYGVLGRTRSGRTTTNIYPPGYDKTYKSQYLLANDKVTFKSGTSGNLLVGKTLTDTKGGKINAGVLFEPNYLKTNPDGITVAIGVVTEKKGGKLEFVRDPDTGMYKIIDPAGTTKTTVEIPYDQVRDDIVIGYGRAVGEGEFDFRKAEEYINYQPGLKPKPIVTPEEKAKFTGRTYDWKGVEYTAEELFDAGWTAAGFAEAVRKKLLKVYKQKK